MNLSKKQLFAAGLAVAAFAGAGAAIAASRPTAQETQKAVIDDAAKQLGVAPDKLQSALQQALVNRVEQAVKDGRLTRAQADQLEARIKAGDVPLTPGFGYGGGPGFGHHGDRGGRGGGMLFGNAFQAAQSYLGVTDQQLAGAIMKVGGSLFLWTIITFLFFRRFMGRWEEQNTYRRSRRIPDAEIVGHDDETLTYEDVTKVFDTVPAAPEPHGPTSGSS